MSEIFRFSAREKARSNLNLFATTRQLPLAFGLRENSICNFDSGALLVCVSFLSYITHGGHFRKSEEPSPADARGFVRSYKSVHRVHKPGTSVCAPCTGVVYEHLFVVERKMGGDNTRGGHAGSRRGGGNPPARASAAAAPNAPARVCGCVWGGGCPGEGTPPPSFLCSNEHRIAHIIG